MIRLSFRGGTLEIKNLDPDVSYPAFFGKWDKRVHAYRTMGYNYATIVHYLQDQHLPFEDTAARFDEFAPTQPVVNWGLREYQEEALSAWQENQRRGVISLPTGTGKTFVGVSALMDCSSGLIVAPTLDLVWQWYRVLSQTFSEEIGVVAGGDYQLARITVTTYSSAHLHMDHLGCRFELIIFDECHHLPTPKYSLGAQMAIAPARLGLSATPHRSEEDSELLWSLVGPLVCEKSIAALKGSYLADYHVERIEVRLTDDEKREYDEERELYLSFLKENQIRLGGRYGWSSFIRRASRTSQGQRAIRAHRRQRELAQTASVKMGVLGSLLQTHVMDRSLVFTEDNRTAYQIAREWFIPIITHQTKVTERADILQRFQDGDYRAIVTSKVLNEGVDVPAANVAIIMSGSGTVREHVQRLGRVLRPGEGKRALLYELVTTDSNEMSTSQRRRKHQAYSQQPKEETA